MLTSDEGRSFEKDILWASIGAACGALSPAVQAIHGLLSKNPAFGLWDLAECVILACAIVVAALMLGFIAKKPEKQGAASLAQEIRDRTATKVGTAG
jgi:hypothetical protein